MNLCSDGHQEVCYEGRTCPCCEKMADMQKEIDNLQARVEELEAKS